MRRDQISRFLTPDPAGYIDSPNLYTYVLNDPINNVDPIGLLLSCAQDPNCTNDPGPIEIRPLSNDTPPGRGGFSVSLTAVPLWVAAPAARPHRG